MKKRTVVSAALAMQLFLCTGAFAYQSEFTNSKAANADLPAKAKLEAYKVGKDFMTTKVRAEWTKEQIQAFQKQDIFRNIPALAFQTDASDALKPKVIMTNLPGVKVDLNTGGENAGDEVIVSMLGGDRLNPNKSYTLYTGWSSRDGNDKPSLTLHSLQRFGQPGGTINDLSDTKDQLARIEWKQVSETNSNFKSAPENLAASSISHVDEKNIKTVKGDYTNIYSKETLEQYRKSAAQRVESLSEQSFWPFAATFKNSATSDPKKLAEIYSLQISQVYAIGKTEDGEEFTVIWFGDDLKDLSLLEKHPRFTKFRIIEIEGRATGDSLRSLAHSSSVSLVEVADKDRQPTGIYWLDQLYCD
ncbi:hypothetical protein SAMN04487970_100433 [Paenibacillus tianmuensis]|uniref:Uncharacterized protein n=1 Tax=Paenibacillus tianmuensis TaxID=624147 RepID=A0A1G4PTZ0_9BACL|nr:hypothetical protein [Paenibacillus tianmuensis]SCW35742.1 hypothetical protein SAMN04487970_100433 [Paenibacillus tianmuensis]